LDCEENFFLIFSIVHDFWEAFTSLKDDIVVHVKIAIRMVYRRHEKTQSGHVPAENLPLSEHKRGRQVSAGDAGRFFHQNVPEPNRDFGVNRFEEAKIIISVDLTRNTLDRNFLSKSY
jgi:hypothetical protein